MEALLILLVIIAGFLAAFIMICEKEIKKFLMVLLLITDCLIIGFLTAELRDKQYEQINQEQNQNSSSENEQRERHYYCPRKWHGV